MDMAGFRPVPLVLAPGTASGYKRVKKVNAKTYQACRTINGKQRHVWTSEDPRECAYVLARLELEPLSEEAIKAACKAAAKERAQSRALQRQRAELSRPIERAYKQYVVAPKRAREAVERGDSDHGVCTDRVPLSPHKNM